MLCNGLQLLTAVLEFLLELPLELLLPAKDLQILGAAGGQTLLLLGDQLLGQLDLGPGHPSVEHLAAMQFLAVQK